MLKRSLFFQVAGPTIFMSAILLGLGVAAAVVLYRLQLTSLDVLDENIESRKVARRLEAAVRDLTAAHLQNQADKVRALHYRIHTLLEDAWEYSDKDEEALLVHKVEQSYQGYHQRWQARPRPDGPG